MARLFKLAFLLCFACPAFPATYYVSNAGSDLNEGTDPKLPFATVLKGTAVMKNGDTLVLDSTSHWFGQLTVPCDSCTFTASTTVGSARPTLTGGQYGVFIGNHPGVKVSYLYATKVTTSGIAAVCSKAINPNGTVIDHVIVDHTGYSGIAVLGCNYATMPLITGVQITNNYVGPIDRPAGLDYNDAGIQLGGVGGALVQGNNVQTVTQMGIQDRPYYSAPCAKNGFYKNSVSNNEGGITAVCPNEDVAYNHIFSGRGFGLQLGVNGTAHDDIIENLSMGTGGILYNGIDGKGATGATYTREIVMNVSGCSLTVEGEATGTTVNGGMYDATHGGQCALYTTASAGPVKFNSVGWASSQSVAKPFGYMMTGPGDAAHKYSANDFVNLVIEPQRLAAQ